MASIAWAPDAADAPDAWAPDAGVPDAADALDAWAPDAAAPDAEAPDAAAPAAVPTPAAAPAPAQAVSESCSDVKAAARQSLACYSEQIKSEDVEEIMDEMLQCGACAECACSATDEPAAQSPSTCEKAVGALSQQEQYEMYKCDDVEISSSCLSQ